VRDEENAAILHLASEQTAFGATLQLLYLHINSLLRSSLVLFLDSKRSIVLGSLKLLYTLSTLNYTALNIPFH
jgi:hypothetical protein